MTKAATGLVAALVVVSGVACGGSDGRGSGDVSNALLTAAEAAQDAESARMEMTVEIGLGTQDVTLQAEGEFDFVEEAGTMTMNTSSGAGMPRIGEMQMILHGDYMYVKGAAFESALGGKEWGRIDVSAAGTAGSGQFNQDPTQYLEWLRGAGGDVEEAGEEEIDGVSTTHYKADLPIDGIIDQAPDEATADAIRSSFAVFGDVESFPVEVWVDEDGLPRRMNLVLESADEDGFSSNVTIDFSDYGIEVDVDPPQSYQDIDSPAG